MLQQATLLCVEISIHPFFASAFLARLPAGNLTTMSWDTGLRTMAASDKSAERPLLQGQEYVDMGIRMEIMLRLMDKLLFHQIAEQSR